MSHTLQLSTVGVIGRCRRLSELHRCLKPSIERSFRLLISEAGRFFTWGTTGRANYPPPIKLRKRPRLPPTFACRWMPMAQVRRMTSNPKKVCCMNEPRRPPIQHQLQLATRQERVGARLRKLQ